MKPKKIEGTNAIISLYDANAKKLIGVFSTLCIVARYIYKHEHNSKKSSYIFKAWSKKIKIHHDNMAYAIRTANEEQKLILGANDYIILNGYKEPTKANMSSFKTNRVYLNSVSKEKMQKYWNKKK